MIVSCMIMLKDKVIIRNRLVMSTVNLRSTLAAMFCWFFLSQTLCAKQGQTNSHPLLPEIDHHSNNIVTSGQARMWVRTRVCWQHALKILPNRKLRKHQSAFWCLGFSESHKCWLENDMCMSTFTWKRPIASDRPGQLQLCLDESWKTPGTLLPACLDNNFQFLFY